VTTPTTRKELTEGNWTLREENGERHLLFNGDQVTWGDGRIDAAYLSRLSLELMKLANAVAKQF